MVAKCSNPECQREFRQLREGRLYLLPPIEAHTLGQLTEHCYWLCPECSAIFELARQGDRVVVLRRSPEPAQTFAVSRVG